MIVKCEFSGNAARQCDVLSKLARTRGGVGPHRGITVIPTCGAAPAPVMPQVRRTWGREMCGENPRSLECDSQQRKMSETRRHGAQRPHPHTHALRRNGGSRRWSVGTTRVPRSRPSMSRSTNCRWCSSGSATSRLLPDSTMPHPVERYVTNARYTLPSAPGA